MVNHPRGAITDEITGAIVAFADRAFASPLTESRRSALTARIIDALGCAVAASDEPEVRRVAAAIGLRLDSPGVRALLNGRGSPGDAAFLNGMMVRYHDWNDTYVGRNGGHPSDLIPLALAAAEQVGATGEATLRALNVGQHLMLDMCDGSNALTRGWDHATYVGIAATIVAGLLLDLDRSQLANALSMTAAANNMLLARSGKVSTWRSLASPHAIRNALFVTGIAKAGVSGPDPVFQGRQGFIEVVSGDMTLELTPDRDRSGDTHLKMFPAVFHAQAPVELALAMRRDVIERCGERALDGPIDDIVVSTHAFAIKWAGSMPGLWEPRNRETADHSIPFMVALALRRGVVGHSDIEGAIDDEAIRSLTRKVKVEEDASFSARWPREAPARLSFRLGETRYRRELSAGEGHAARPLAEANRARKLIHNASHVVGEQRAHAWAAKLERFAELRDIGEALSP